MNLRSRIERLEIVSTSREQIGGTVFVLEGEPLPRNLHPKDFVVRVTPEQAEHFAPILERFITVMRERGCIGHDPDLIRDVTEVLAFVMNTGRPFRTIAGTP